MRHDRLLKSIIGEEVFESLSKALSKLSTGSIVDIGELYHSLNIAPKAVVAFLVRELKDMKAAKQVKLPWADGAVMLVNKLGNDVYNGHIAQNGSIRHEFNLTSLPALAAHLTSHFELYDKQESGTAEQALPDNDRLRALEAKLTQVQIQMLESKINDLMSIVANRSASEDVQKSEPVSKAGTMPTMPHPPKPGTKVGGKQGIAQTGLVGSKTQASDRLSKPIKAIINKPQISAPKPKTLTFQKTDLMRACLDCGKNEFDEKGNYVGCPCWHGMSKPKVKKNEKDKVTLEFGPDWDIDALSALINSVKGYGRNNS